MTATTELINRYEQAIERLEDAMRGLTPGDLDRPPGPGKWTIRQIVIHLADAEIVYAGRIRAVAGQPDSPLAAFDQEQWASNMPYRKLPIEPALAMVRALRACTSVLLRALPEE